MCKYDPQERIGDCNVCEHSKNGICDIENIDKEIVGYWLNEGYDYEDASKAECPFWRFDNNKKDYYKNKYEEIDDLVDEEL